MNQEIALSGLTLSFNDIGPEKDYERVGLQSIGSRGNITLAGGLHSMGACILLYKCSYVFVRPLKPCFIVTVSQISINKSTDIEDNTTQIKKTF